MFTCVLENHIMLPVQWS